MNLPRLLYRFDFYFRTVNVDKRRARDHCVRLATETVQRARRFSRGDRIMPVIGLDFGTTNSALCIAGAGDEPVMAQFALGAAAVGVAADNIATTDTFRSILFFNAEQAAVGGGEGSFAGPGAIREYLAAGGNGRLIQSLKSFLADRGFQSTQIFDRIYRLEDLVALILIPLRAEAEAFLGTLGNRAVVGRPVHFSSAAGESDERLAETRLEVALKRAGFERVIFEYEPVAAAYHYARRIDREEVVLIGDFGGGTSDFSLLRISPGAGERRHIGYEILGNDGVAIAGDAFDRELLRHLVAPELGRGSKYRSPYGRILPMPNPIYFNFERWHQLSFMKARATMNKLEALRAMALEADKIAALIHIVGNDLGYLLFKSVERAKAELSSADESVFKFTDGPVAIEKRVTREEFERWISPELNAIAGCVDRLMNASGLARARVDRVFLTGGSSFVPAVRRIFAMRFGADRIRTGDEFSSVARGLALRALDLER
jgi:hypothetical chaperone protein